jgi:hypothetical protein
LKIFAANLKPNQLDAHDNHEMKLTTYKLGLWLSLSCLPFFCCAEESPAWNPCPSALSAGHEDADTNALQRWDLTLSPYTHHWRYSQDHKPVVLGALEHRVAQNRFCGVALFRNSFGQPSTYVYVGKQWEAVLDNPKLFTKVSAGLIYGYKGQYQHKIPFNDYGIAPAIIPSLGWHITPTESAQVMVLGRAGLLFAYGHRF